MLTMFAEVRQGDEWYKVGKSFKSTYDELDGQLTDRVYDGHDKQLISFLKAQCYGGVPQNMSNKLKTNKFFQNIAIYYATLKDLLSFDWDESIHKTGYISEWQYERLKEDGIKPVNIFDKPYRSDALIVYPFQMDLIINYPSLRDGISKIYVVYQYEYQRYRDLFKFFCEESIPALIKLIPDEGTVDDVRIVFSA